VISVLRYDTSHREKMTTGRLNST